MHNKALTTSTSTRKGLTQLGLRVCDLRQGAPKYIMVSFSRPMAAVTPLALYALGFPVLLSFFFALSWRKVQQDQAASGEGRGRQLSH
jgi:hypothetical protein